MPLQIFGHPDKTLERYEKAFAFPKKDRRAWVILSEHPLAPEPDLFDSTSK